MTKIIATIEIDDGEAPDFADQTMRIEEVLESISWVASVKTEEG